MSKTITLKDVQQNPEEAVRRAREQGRAKARFHVIQAKRALTGAKSVAWVEGRKVDGGVNARTDLKVKA